MIEAHTHIIYIYVYANRYIIYRHIIPVSVVSGGPQCFKTHISYSGYLLMVQQKSHCCHSGGYRKRVCCEGHGCGGVVAIAVAVAVPVSCCSCCCCCRCIVAAPVPKEEHLPITSFWPKPGQPL